MKAKTLLTLLGLMLTVLMSAAKTTASEPSSGAGPQPGEDMGELAKKLNNPAASLISVPLQSNFDFGGGPNDDGFQYKLNVQPVIPFGLNEDWKIISRTIVPYIYQEDRIGTSSQSGLGDSTVTLWFSPEKEKPGAPVWGIGPVFQVPTATDDLLGTEKWGVGPSAIFLRQAHGWTMGFLANHLWSFAGEDRREDVSVTSLQPFLNFQTRTHTTFGMNSEYTYDWEADHSTVPLNFFVTQLVRIGKMPVSFQLGGRYYADKPDEGPDWGLRFAITLVFPK